MRSPVEEAIAEPHRAHDGEIVAPLIRLLGSFEAAEDVVRDAFAAAVEGRRETGVPADLGVRERPRLAHIGKAPGGRPQARDP